MPTGESLAALAARIRDETPRREALVRASGARLDRRARVVQPAVARTPDGG